MRTAPDEHIVTELNKDSFYYKIFLQAIDREFQIRSDFGHRFEEADELDRHTPTRYLEQMNEHVPENRVLRSVDQTLYNYVHLEAFFRNITDLAFSGLLFSALTDPDFSSLCKDKSRDVSGMSIEEKMDVPLDHEALYSFLLAKLGVEEAA